MKRLDDPSQQQAIEEHSDSNYEDDEDEHLNNAEIQITIKKLDGETFLMTCSRNATVLGLKTLINDQHSIASNLQRLIYRAQELQDEFPISQYGVQEQSTIHLVVRRNISQQSQNSGDPNSVNIGIGNGNGNDTMVDPYQRGFGQIAAADLNDVMNVVRLCRFVRIFALIDAVFLLIYGLQAFYFIILAILAIAGYWGSKNLDRKYLVMYGICLILEITVRIYLIYLDSSNIVNIILLVLMILIDLFVLRCVIRLYQAIPLLSPDQRDRILILNRVGLI